MSEQVVMAVYRPKEGRDEALRELIRRHVDTLRRLGLATDRPVTVLKTLDGEAYLEIFGWVSPDAARQAHETPEVQEIWGAMMEIADFPALGEIEAGKTRFPHFEAVGDLGD